MDLFDDQAIFQLGLQLKRWNCFGTNETSMMITALYCTTAAWHHKY